MNKIYYFSERDDVLNLNGRDTYYVEIDCQHIETKVALLDKLKYCFRLPDAHNWDSVLDWLTDLSWIDKEAYLLCLVNFNQLLPKDDINRHIFLDILSDTVDWWNGDVENYVVGGKKKAFNVYIVN